MQPQPDEGPRAFIDYIVRSTVCEHCRHPYQTENVQAVFHRDEQWTLQATCADCGMTQSLTAFDRPPYMRLWPTSPVIPSEITADDLDAWRRFLTGFEGDIVDLLGS